MVQGITVDLDEDEEIFDDYHDLALENFLIDETIELRAIVSNENKTAISWVFRIADTLVRGYNGRIIGCDAAVYSTGFRDVHLVLDKTEEPIVLPFITPAEYFRVIINPLASEQIYDSYGLQCRESFHSHSIMGITGIATDTNPAGIDFCIRIADELKRFDSAKEIAMSGWIYGQKQYAVDVVMMHADTPIADLFPRGSPNWNHSWPCKLKRRPLLLKR